MLIRFDDRAAIVTEAAHGFGRAIALSLAGLGARVIACDLLKAELNETARLATEQKTPIQVGVVDVCDRAAVHAMVAKTLEAGGRIDILVNDAGGLMGQVSHSTRCRPTTGAIFAANLEGAFYCS